MIILWIVLSLTITSAFAASPEYTEAYRQAFERARQAEFEKAAGVAYQAAYGNAKAQSYQKTRQTLIASGAYRFHRQWLLVVLLASISAGFLLQHWLTGALRREGALRGDLDRFLLGPEYARCRLQVDRNS